MTGGIVAAVVATALGGVGVQSAAAAEPLRAGEAFGVRIEPHGRTMTIVFEREARALHRRLAGFRVDVTCWDGSTGAGAQVVVPRRRLRIRTRNITRGADYCRLVAEPQTVRGRRVTMTDDAETFVSIPLSPDGVVQIDEEVRALAMWGIVDGPESHGSFPAPQEVAAESRAWRGAPFDVVALAGPADMPPGDAVGYWSNGTDHAVAVTVTSSGRRMFVELLPGQELRTNILSYMFDAELY